MQTLAEFVTRNADLSEAEFKSRHGCGFLLLTAAAADGDGGGGTFDTQLGTDVRDALKRTFQDARIYPLVKRGAHQLPTRVTIGRVNNNDIVLESDRISKLHAYFKIDRDGRHSLCDAGSTNGTLLDGKPLEANRPVSLQGGETMTFGNRFEASFHTPDSLFRHLGFLKRWMR